MKIIRFNESVSKYIKQPGFIYSKQEIEDAITLFTDEGFKLNRIHYGYLDNLDRPTERIIDS